MNPAEKKRRLRISAAVVRRHAEQTTIPQLREEMESIATELEG